MAGLNDELQQFQQRLGQRIEDRRDELGMNRKALALAAGYRSHTMISEIEGGTAMPSLAKLVALARALQWTVEELFGGRVEEEAYQQYQAIVRMVARWHPLTRKEFAGFVYVVADHLARA